MKPIRIFLIGTLTSALFMVAYYRQKNMHSNNFRDICLLLGGEEFGRLSGDDYLKGIDFHPYYKIAKMISSEIIICIEPRVKCIKMNFNNRARALNTKLGYLSDIKKVFHEDNIDPNRILEVYHSNRTCHQYIKYLNSKITLIGFEHGVGDVKNFLSYNQGWRVLKNMLKNFWGRSFFLFNAYAENDDIVVSIYASKIRRINKNIRVEALQSSYVNDVASKIIYNEIRDKSFFEDNNGIGVILLPDITRFTLNKEQHLRFHRNLIEYVIKKAKNLEPEVNAFILKAKESDKSSTDEIVESCVDKIDSRKLINSKRLLKVNYPIEFYLEALNPRVIFGNFSSGTFYAKAINPKIHTYSFHRYVMSYIKNNFSDSFFPDLNNSILTLNCRYKDIFKDVLPFDMPCN